MKTFRSIRKFLVPRWLSEGEGELVGYALDAMKDAFLERLRLGHLARFPQNGPNGETAPEDALTAMGRDRRVIRGINETSVAYAARLTQWLVERRTAGNAFTLLRQLAAYTGPGFSFRTYDARGNCYSRDVNGNETAVLQGTWNWDGATARWSRFWVVIYPSALWSISTATWGDAATPDWNPNAGQWGVDIPREHIRSVQAIVADWKPAGTRCVHIIVAFDPTSFDPASPEPDGTWGGWGKDVGGVRVPARLTTTARYLNGS
jgi:hypothetical protein